jgi:transcriptional regulator with XRE-family HTH domain
MYFGHTTLRKDKMVHAIGGCCSVSDGPRRHGWGVPELAEKAGVTANTVTRIEKGADAKQPTMDALQRALEAAAVSLPMVNSPGSASPKPLQRTPQDPQPSVPAEKARPLVLFGSGN